MFTANPLLLIENYPVEETKLLLKQLKEDLNIASSSGDTDEIESLHIDILLCTIDSLEKELAKVKEITNLSKEKQARILADTYLIVQFLQSQEAFDEDDDYEEIEDEE